MRNGLLDQITTPASQNLLEPDAAWCADNGIYSQAYPGDGQYLRWLSTLPGPARCRFAVAPDVVADHNATLERSWPMLRRIREAGLPVALCAQNGATPDDLPWDYIDAVFLAGIVECVPCGWVPSVAYLPLDGCPNGHQLAEWKTSDIAWRIAAEAKAHGKWVHMGRVNTRNRMLKAKAMGCDSADGTYLAFGPDQNLPSLLSWLCEPVERAAVQMDLFADAATPALLGEVA
ncbi:hypothetical protein [Paractinoplanes ferrugineus]|nr:hypothetical protein [Actinoplanes ferrugineus]